MFDENEVIQQEPEETTEQQEQVQAAPAPQESFRQLREKLERAERERDDLARFVAAGQSQQKPQPDEDDDPTSEDSIVEYRQLKKYKKELKSVQQQLEQQRLVAEQSVVEAKLRRKYDDLDQVLSEDNIKSLRALDPDTADAISRTSDYYTKMLLAYKAIKETVPFDEGPIQDKVVAQRNAVKPRPLTSISAQQGETPMSRANAFSQGLTDDLKAQLHKEMMEAIRNR